MPDENTPVSLDMDASMQPQGGEAVPPEVETAAMSDWHDGQQYHVQEVALENTGAPPPTLWQQIRKKLLGQTGSAQEIDARLWNLTQAVEHYPDSAMNYVLRGELYLALGDLEPAAQDFSQALELATAQVEDYSWGVLAQAAQDRAGKGLARIKRLQHQQKSSSGN